MLLAMTVHIEVSDLMVGMNALKRKDFRTASRYFSKSFALARPDRFPWQSPRYHAHAIALMGLDDWTGALDAIQKAVDAQATAEDLDSTYKWFHHEPRPFRMKILDDK